MTNRLRVTSRSWYWRTISRDAVWRCFAWMTAAWEVPPAACSIPRLRILQPMRLQASTTSKGEARSIQRVSDLLVEAREA